MPVGGRFYFCRYGFTLPSGSIGLRDEIETSTVFAGGKPTGV